MWGVSKLHVSLGISSHHRRTTIASKSWLLLLIHASHSCIPCRVLVHFSGFLGRKGNYRDSFERHSSPPFIFIYFSRTNTLFTLLHIIFFFSFLLMVGEPACEHGGFGKMRMCMAFLKLLGGLLCILRKLYQTLFILCSTTFGCLAFKCDIGRIAFMEWTDCNWWLRDMVGWIGMSWRMIALDAVRCVLAHYDAIFDGI